MKRIVVTALSWSAMIVYVPLALVEGVSRRALDCLDTAIWKMERW